MSPSGTTLLVVPDVSATLPNSGFRAVAHRRLLDLRNAARRSLFSLHQAFHRCAEAITTEGITFYKQLSDDIYSPATAYSGILKHLLSLTSGALK